MFLACVVDPEHIWTYFTCHCEGFRPLKISCLEIEGFEFFDNFVVNEWINGYRCHQQLFGFDWIANVFIKLETNKRRYACSNSNYHSRSYGMRWANCTWSLCLRSVGLEDTPISVESVRELVKTVYFQHCCVFLNSSELITVWKTFGLGAHVCVCWECVCDENGRFQRRIRACS